MTITYAQTVRQAQMNNYAILHGSAAQHAIFSGAVPTDVDTAFSGNAILGALPLSATPFGTASAAKPAVIVANALIQENAYATGTATFFRTYVQSTAGITGSGFIAGKVYMIQSMGTSTQANWVSIGAPAISGVTPTVGTLFIATATTLTGTGTAYLMNELEQGTVGTTGADLNLNSTQIVAGGPIAVSTYSRWM